MSIYLTNLLLIYCIASKITTGSSSMFSSEELASMDGLTNLRYFQQANFDQHSTSTVPITKPAKYKVNKPITSMLKADSTTPLLPPGKTVNIPTTRCSSSTALKEDTGTRRLSGLVNTNTSHTRIQSQRDATDDKFDRPSVGS